MKKYNVQITDTALADMEDIYNYIAEQLHAPENAMGQYDRIAEAIESLSTFPERMPLMALEPEHTPGLRQLPIDNFLIFYVVRGTLVIVVRVLYGASDISHRLPDNE